MDRPASEWIESRYLRGLVCSLAWRYRLSNWDSEDLLQDVRLALFVHGLDRSVNSSFLVRMVIHKRADTVRRKIRADRISQQHVGIAVSDKELLCLLRASVSTFPEPLRKFYELRYRKGFNGREVSRRLGRSREAVRWMDTRLRESLGRPNARSDRSGSKKPTTILAAPSDI